MHTWERQHQISTAPLSCRQTADLSTLARQISALLILFMPSQTSEQHTSLTCFLPLPNEPVRILAGGSHHTPQGIELLQRIPERTAPGETYIRPAKAQRQTESKGPPPLRTGSWRKSPSWKGVKTPSAGQGGPGAYPDYRVVTRKSAHLLQIRC